MENDMVEKYKTVALRLHALSEKDRRWCLQQLTDAQRCRLDPLLEELSLLGIPKVALSPDELKVLSDAGESPPSEEDKQPGFEGMIAAADPLVVAELLRGEPDLLVAALVRAGNWPWVAAVLDGLPDSRRERISDYTRQQVFPPSIRVKTVMFERFAEKCSALTEQSRAANTLRLRDAPVSRPGLFRRLLWQR